MIRVSWSNSQPCRATYGVLLAALCSIWLKLRAQRAKELDEHRGYYRLWLPRDHRLVWQVLDADEIVDLLYVGPKQPDLYQQLGLGRQTM